MVLMNMDDNSSNFCISCGAPLRDSDTFCPTCGATVGQTGSTSGTPMPSHTRSVWSSKLSLKLIILAMLSIIWAVIILYLSLTIISNIDSIMNSVIDRVGSDYDQATIDSLRSVLTALGYMWFVGGILSLVTGILVLFRKLHTITVVICIVASITSLPYGIIGFIVAYFIHKSKPEFTS